MVRMEEALHILDSINAACGRQAVQDLAAIPSGPESRI
jgi:hypothetical protein